MAELIALCESVLAHTVAQHFSMSLQVARFQTFADGEVNVTLDDPERYAGKLVVILQSTIKPVNDYLLGIAFLAQELKNAGAKRVVAVIPYFGYSRQEASDIDSKPGHAAVVSKLYESAGIDELFTVELHEPSMLSFFSIPAHNLTIESVIADCITAQALEQEKTCLVAPDSGIAEYVQQIAKQLKVGAITFGKQRFAADQTRITNVEDECHGSIGIIIDDILATGGTALHVCDALAQMGYQKIYGYFVHPVLAGNAIERIKNSAFDTVFVGNTLPLSKEAQLAGIQQFDISPILITALNSIMKEDL